MSNGGSRETGRATSVSKSTTAETYAKDLDLGGDVRALALRTEQTNTMSHFSSPRPGEDTGVD